MHHTYKGTQAPTSGIYMKFRANGGVITDILYENITIQEPEQWAIWIGPAQQVVSQLTAQADSADICYADPCSLCWPELADLGAQVTFL